MSLLETLGERLRSAGLSPRSLEVWAGTDRLSALPALRARLLERELTPASTLLALFVAGAEVPVDRLRLELDLNALHRLGLIDVSGPVARAQIALLPLGQALLVCDRLDAKDHPDLVCAPDDSSYHLALSLPPGRKPRWLDLGSGSAFAPLYRPELAMAIGATDINARAVEFARQGTELSTIAHVTTFESDLSDDVPTDWHASSIVSCNAPIPEQFDAPYRPRWKSTDLAFFERLFTHAKSCVAAGGLVVVHGAIDALAPVIADLPGERTLVVYTPPDVRGFGIAWWAPDNETRHVSARRLLTEARPHLTHEDRIAALAGTLPVG